MHVVKLHSTKLTFSDWDSVKVKLRLYSDSELANEPYDEVLAKQPSPIIAVTSPKDDLARRAVTVADRMATVERIVASPERGIDASRRVSEEGPFDEMASVPKLGRSLFPSPTARKPPHQMSKASTVQLQTQRGLTRSESYGQQRSKSERHSGEVKRSKTFPLAMKRSALARAVLEATDELTPKVLSYENEKVPGTPEAGQCWRPPTNSHPRYCPMRMRKSQGPPRKHIFDH